MDGKKRTFYYFDEELHLREVRWGRLKIGGAVVSLLMIGVVLALVLYASVFDVFGGGDRAAAALRRENQALLTELQTLRSRLGAMESGLGELHRQGNELRLLVDLPAVDSGAGTGGASPAPALADPAVTSSDARSSLERAASALQTLSGQIRVEQQSYRQILDKMNGNRAYFAALPSLKPMAGFYAANEFGPRMHPVLGVVKTHQGLDIVNDVGTPVVAAADGVVEVAGRSGAGYGTVIVLRHGFGYQTVYAHLSKVLVHEGEHVSRGTVIARSGRTGLVSGPHLHYEVRLNGVCRNPLDYFFDDDATGDGFRLRMASADPGGTGQPLKD